jgi:hypothetical protein
MGEFLVQGTQAEKKGVEDLCLPVNIWDNDNPRNVFDYVEEKYYSSFYSSSCV